MRQKPLFVAPASACAPVRRPFVQHQEACELLHCAAWARASAGEQEQRILAHAPRLPEVPGVRGVYYQPKTLAGIARHWILLGLTTEHAFQTQLVLEGLLRHRLEVTGQARCPSAAQVFHLRDLRFLFWPALAPVTRPERLVGGRQQHYVVLCPRRGLFTGIVTKRTWGIDLSPGEGRLLRLNNADTSHRLSGRVEGREPGAFHPWRVILRPEFDCPFESFTCQGSGARYGFRGLPEGRYTLTVREVIWGSPGSPLLVTTVDLTGETIQDLWIRAGERK